MGGFKQRQIVGTKNSEEFKQKLALNSLKFSLEDIKDLPESIENPIPITLEKKTEQMYKVLVSESVEPLETALNLQRVTSGIIKDTFESKEKLTALLNYLNSIKQTEKIVIWCRFTDTMDWLKGVIAEKGYNADILDGQVRNKADLIAEFNTNPEFQVLIAQIQLGIGWEIPVAKHALFYELDFSRVNLIQAKGRNKRLKGSETGRVVYTYLLAKNTIDERIYEVLKRKEFTSIEALSCVKGGDMG